MEVRRCVFHAGCPSFGAPDGVLMVRADAKASTEVWLEFGLFTMIAPGVKRDSTGASRLPATGSQSG
jgi:hypothetical protein